MILKNNWKEGEMVKSTTIIRDYQYIYVPRTSFSALLPHIQMQQVPLNNNEDTLQLNVYPGSNAVLTLFVTHQILSALTKVLVEVIS